MTDNRTLDHKIWGIAWPAILSNISIPVLGLVLHSPLFALLTDLDHIRQLMSRYYLWLVLLPLVAAPSYLLDGVFIGSAETRYMMTTMLFSVLVIYLPTWYFSRGWGNHGLWLAFTAFNTARGVTLYYCYRQMTRQERWLHIRATTTN